MLFQNTTGGSSQSTSPMMSHMLAGVAGGGVAFLAGNSTFLFPFNLYVI
jgi:hypothetical protein